MERPIAFVSVPGEIFPATAKKIKDRLKDEGSQWVNFVGMAQHCLGYLMSEEDCAIQDPEIKYFRSLATSCESASLVYDGLFNWGGQL